MSTSDHSPGLGSPALERAVRASPGFETPRSFAALMLPDDRDAALVHGIGSTAVSQCQGDSLAALLQHSARFDLALLTRDWLAQSDASSATRAVVGLRDLHAGAVLAVSDSRAPLGSDDWRALGYTPRSTDEGIVLYGFNLYDYKRLPEWLNARHWANPELWDVYRW